MSDRAAANHTIRQTCAYGAHSDKRELAAALRDGLSGTAQIVADYEAAIARLYGARHVIAVSSGAAAVTAALAAIDHAPGDEVVVAPTSPICTVLPILAMHLKPVFCDVAPDSFGFDESVLRRCVGDRTRAVIEVPMWGYPVRSDRTAALLAAREIPLIQDLAHGHLTRLNGNWLAAIGDIACFSTHESKFMSTGEGGFVIVNDDDRAARVRAYTRFGNLSGESVGLNLKLGGLQAALGLARSHQLLLHREARLAQRAALLARLNNAAFRELPIVPDGEVNGHALLLQAVTDDGRKLVHYQQAHGIPSDVGKYDNRPLFELPLLAGYARPCPNAARLLRSLTTVPLHPELTEPDLDYIAGVLNGYVPA